MNQVKIRKNYVNVEEKRSLQFQNFELIRSNIDHLLCLAGPQPYAYQKVIPNQILKVDSYEMLSNDYILQEALSLDPRFHFHYGKITNEFLTENTFVDGDFCSTINGDGRFIYNFIKDIKNHQFQVTLSMRPTGKTKTFDLFFHAVNEKFLHKQGNIYITNENKYKIDTYSDTCAMLTIFKL